MPKSVTMTDAHKRKVEAISKTSFHNAKLVREPIPYKEMMALGNDCHLLCRVK